jgi:uncharacterized membrane protein
MDLKTIARGDFSRVLDARRMVVRDDVEWRALWAAHAGPDRQAPIVDFGSRMIAAAFRGQLPSAGGSTAIIGATTDGRVLTIRVADQSPPAERPAAQVLVSPFHIVSLPRFDGEVRFDDHAAPADSPAPVAPVASAASVADDDDTRPTAHTAATRQRPRTPAAPTTRLPGRGASTTGLAETTAGTLAYLAGPFSGALLLVVERTNRDVRFHAWQAFLGLGSLGLLAIVCLGLAFAMLIVSPRIFSAMRWAAAVMAAAWVVVWAICLIQAYKGRRWPIPLIGARAARLAER